MINNRADYRFVGGDIGQVAIDGGVMPVRPGIAKNVLRGEDICFMAEAHEARADLWNGAVFKESGAAYNAPPVDVQLSVGGTPFDFTKALSFTQLSSVAAMHEADSAKRPGSGSHDACSPFFLKRQPRPLSGSYDSVFPDLQNELAGIVQDTALLMPAASLNGKILLRSELEDMFTDNSLFRLYGCGMTDLNYGFGIGPAGDADRFEDDPTGRITGLNVNNNIFNNYAIVYDGQKGMEESWPKDAFTLASFDDDGDVDSAELWGVLLLELDRSGFSYWVWYGKLCDFQLQNNVWYARRAGWRGWLRGMWQDMAGVQLPSSASDLPSQNFHQNAVTRLYAPFAVVHPKQRFIW